MGDPGVDTNRQIKVVLTKLRIRHMRLTRGPMGNHSEARCKGLQESLSVAHVVGRLQHSQTKGAFTCLLYI